MTKNILVFIGLIFIANVVFGQNISINDDGSAPDPSAMLDVSDTTRGLLIPRMTLTQRNSITSPASGLIVFQTDNSPGFYFNSGTPAIPNWQQLITENDLGDPVSINDANNDTKVQVEEGTNDDIIRFDQAGTEFFRMDSGRFEVVNANNSVVIGDNSGSQLISNNNSYQNVVVGNNSLNGIIGRDNVGLGYNVLTSTTSNAVRENTAIGQQSMQALTSGFHNTAIGRASLTNLSTGFENTAIGRSTLGGNTGGSRNTALGNQAGLTTTGSRNVFIGNQAGIGFSGDDALFIDNSNTTTPLIYGDFANDSVKIYGQLSVGNAYTFPNSTPATGNVLTHDGTGLVWSNPAADENGIYSGSGSLMGNTTISGANDTLSFTSNVTHGFNVDGTTFSIDAANNRVGIGDATPEGMLSLNQAGSPGIPGIFLDGFGNTEGDIAFDNGESLQIGHWDGSSFTERMRINASGNVGIGATSPLSRLQIGDGTLSANNMLLFGNTSTTTETFLPRIHQLENNSNSNSLAIGTASNTGDILFYTGTTSSASSLLGTGSSSLRMIIEEAGNVGIGTNNPSILLEVNSASETFNPMFYINNQNAVGGDAFMLFRADNSQNFSIGVDGGGTQDFIIAKSNVLSSNQYFAIDGVTGDVDVFQKMTVGGELNASSLTVNSAYTFPNSVGNDLDVLQTDASGNVSWVSLAAASSLWNISGSDINYTAGNVGIGTSTPNNNLTITDDEPSVGIRSFGSATTENGAVFFYKANGTEDSPTIVVDNDVIGEMRAFGYDGNDFESAAKIQMEIDGTPASNSMPSRIQFHTTADGNNTTTERMRIDSKGYLGIGTESPDNKVHILDGALKVENTGTGSGYNNLMFLSNSTGQSLITRYNYDANSSIPDSVWHFRSSGNNTKGFVFSKADGTLLMSLGAESSSGRIGVGLNNPTSRLEVDGDLEIDGNGSAGDDAFYFGDPSTDGTWRIKRDGNDLSFERRESGSWVFKMKINP